MKLTNWLVCAVFALSAALPAAADDIPAHPLQGKIEHSETLQPAPRGMAEGAKFDESALPKLVSQNNWVPVPKWLAGTWQFKTETVTYIRSFDKKTYPDVPFTLRNEFQKTIGYQRDKSGQIWDYVKAPYSYTTKLDGGLKGYERVDSVTIVSDDSEGYTRAVIGPDSVIDPESQQILLTQQKECFNRYTPMADDAIRLDGSTKVFSMQGNPKVLKISNMLAMRVKPFAPIDEKDGENLRQLFAEFLTAHGKTNLIP